MGYLQHMTVRPEDLKPWTRRCILITNMFFLGFITFAEATEELARAEAWARRENRK